MADGEDAAFTYSRRMRVTEIDAHPGTKAELEAKYGRVWDTDELKLN